MCIIRLGAVSQQRLDREAVATDSCHMQCRGALARVAGLQQLVDAVGCLQQGLEELLPALLHRSDEHLHDARGMRAVTGGR